MAETTTLVARFDGDITGLQKSNAKANQIVDGFAKNTATASKNVEKTTNKIGMGFKAIGGMIRSVTPFLDDATASMVYFGTMATDAIKNAFDAVSKFAGFLKGGLFLAVAAAAAGLGYMLGRMIAGTDATERALKSLYRVSDALKVTRESLKGYSDAWEKYEAALKKVGIEYSVFGNKEALMKARLDATSDMMVENATRIQSHEKAISDDAEALADNIAEQNRLTEAIKLADLAWGPYTEKSYPLYEALENLRKAEAALHAEQVNRSIQLNSLVEDQDALTKNYVESAAILREVQSPGASKFEMDMPAVITDQIAEAVKAYDVLDARIDKSKVSMQNQMLDFVASLAPSFEAVGVQFTQLWTSFSQGFGDAVGRAIVYGDDFGKAMQELGKQLLSTLVSFLIQTVINTLLYGVLATLIQGGLAAGRIALQASIASAAAYAAAIETFGLAGFAAGPALAAAAAAGTAAAANTGFGIGRAATSGLGGMAVSGVGAFAEGGLITAPTLALIGEKGDEAVVPLERLQEMLGGRGTTEVNIVLDDRVIAHAVVPWIPGIVHAKGVKGI